MGWRDLFRGNARTTDDVVREAEDAREAPQPAESHPGDPLEQVEELVRAGEKIQAIKAYREHYGTSLADAKDAIDAIARGGEPVTPEAKPAPPSGVTIQELVDQGKLIDAIKEYRAVHGGGLLEAKEAVDQMRGAAD